MKSVPQVGRQLADDRIMNPRKVCSENLGNAAIKFGMAKMIKDIRIGKLVDTEMQAHRHCAGDADKNKS